MHEKKHVKWFLIGKAPSITILLPCT